MPGACLLHAKQVHYHTNVALTALRQACTLLSTLHLIAVLLHSNSSTSYPWSSAICITWITAAHVATFERLALCTHDDLSALTGADEALRRGFSGALSSISGLILLRSAYSEAVAGLAAEQLRAYYTGWTLLWLSLAVINVAIPVVRHLVAGDSWMAHHGLRSHSFRTIAKAGALSLLVSCIAVPPLFIILRPLILLVGGVSFVAIILLFAHPLDPNVRLEPLAWSVFGGHALAFALLALRCN